VCTRGVAFIVGCQGYIFESTIAQHNKSIDKGYSYVKVTGNSSTMDEHF